MQWIIITAQNSEKRQFLYYFYLHIFSVVFKNCFPDLVRGDDAIVAFNISVLTCP